MFKNPFSFEGRIRRLEYGLSYLIFIVFTSIMEIILSNTGIDTDYQTVILLILFIPGYWFLFAQGAKRCHDRDNSGWFQIIPFYLIWMIFADGDYGSNRFGFNPKGLGNIDEVDLIGTDMQ